MKLPNLKFKLIGSIKARCNSHKNKIILTVSFISTLVLLMTSLVWTPAEATYKTPGFGIFVDGQIIASTLTSEDAYAILEGVAAKYKIEDADFIHTGYVENVTVEACEVALKETKSVSDSINYIISRESPLFSVLSTQTYKVYDDIVENSAYTIENYSFEAIDKIGTELYKGTRISDVILTMKNDEIVNTEIANKMLSVTAKDQSAYKALKFTKDKILKKTVQFRAPVEMNITCPYGADRIETDYHLGVDFYNPCGTPIMAAADGVVSHIGYEDSYGKLIIIDHGGNIQTYYAHCNTTDVEVGDQISQGDYIGTVGNTGRTTGSHLHFEIRLNSATINPMDFL